MRRRALTVIELIVIIGVLLLLAAFLLPVLGRVRHAAGMSQSQNNLRMLGLAVHNLHDVYGKLPPMIGKVGNGEGPVHFHMLPYIEQDNVYRQAGGASWKNGTYGHVIPIYVDPADTSAPPGNQYQGWLATTNYAGNWLMFQKGDKSLANIVDGTSNTLMFTTRYQMCNGTPTGWGYPEFYTWAPMFAFYSTAKPQLNPTQEACNPDLPQSIGNTLLIGMADGSVQVCNPAVSPRTWRHLCDPADGNVIEPDFQN